MAGAPVVFVAHHHLVASGCVRVGSHGIVFFATSRCGGVSSSSDKRTVNAELHARIFSLATWKGIGKICSRRIGRNCRPASTLSLSRHDSDVGIIVEAHDTFCATLGKTVAGESRKGLDVTDANTIRIL
jgi:hypothetical protein